MCRVLYFCANLSVGMPVSCPLSVRGYIPGDFNRVLYQAYPRILYPCPLFVSELPRVWRSQAT